MISLEQFINENTGKYLGVPWNKELDGQCVSLVQQYISQCLNQPMKPRGNAKDWATTYVNEGLGIVSNTLQKGDILVWGSDEGNGYGHVGVYYENNQMFNQNNPWGSPAHLSNLFGSYTILRPNTSQADNYVGTPVERNNGKEQLKVNVYNLICRDSSSLSANKLGWIREGIYNIQNTTESEGYTWYQVEENKWIPNKDDWCTIFPKEDIPTNEVEELKKEIGKLNKQIADLQAANNNLEELLEQLKNYKEFLAPTPGIYYIDLNKDESILYKEKD